MRETMDVYKKYGRVYPAIAGMLLPALATVWMVYSYWSEAATVIKAIKLIVGIFIPTALVYAAIGYALRELCRSISKWLFQFPLFKEDETKMPTTEMLLWRNHLVSDEYHQTISQKVAERFNIHLMTKEEEEADIVEARLLIVNAVQNMRQVTRDDKILLQYNCEFGFCRNYLGASVVAIVLLIAIAIFGAIWSLLPIWASMLFFLLQMVFFVAAFFSLRHRGKSYAQQLFTSFMNLP